MKISPSEFTCTASSSLCKDKTCENVYTESGGEWVTNGTGDGEWIKIEFHTSIRISKIGYRHNKQRTGKCCSQNFKDISFQFSDGTIANATVDDVFEADFHYRIYPPIVSSYLLVVVRSVYNHYKAAWGLELAEYEDNYFGIGNIGVFGEAVTGKGIFFNLLIKHYCQI